MRATVVIASKNVPVISQLSNILIKRDYSILIENSGLHSILKVLDEEIKILILDLDMEPRSSIDLIDIIRRMRRNLIIISISRDNSVETLRKLKEAGVYYCIIKPIQDEELEEVFDAAELLRYKKEELRKAEM